MEGETEKCAKLLSGSEAVYGFVAWLTTRRQTITLGSMHDAAPACDLIEKFCELNNLPDPSDNWHEMLLHPKESG